MAKWHIPALLIAAGMCMFAAGMVYGVVTVGVPTQDATPALVASEERDANRAGVLMAVGLVAGMVGLAALAVVAIVWAVRRSAQDTEPPSGPIDMGENDNP